MFHELIPNMRSPFAALVAVSAVTLCATAAEPIVLNVWPATPPGDTATLPPEADLTKDTDELIAGRRIIKLGNVTTPQLAVYRPAKKEHRRLRHHLPWRRLQHPRLRSRRHRSRRVA